METSAIDFVPLGLDAAWPSQRWIEFMSARSGKPVRGVRLAHASAAAMVLVCTYPRDRFDVAVAAAGADPVVEVAYETTFTLVNLALHQVKVPGARPDGLVGSLMQFASQQASRHPDWAATHWGHEAASIIGMAGWQSGFSLDFPDCYVIAHACGLGIDQLQLSPVLDLSGYENGSDPQNLGAMHWELWRNEPVIGYKDLARVLVSP